MRDAVYGLSGALRMARMDGSGIDYIGRDARSAWASLWALAVIVPGQLILILIGDWPRIAEGTLLGVTAVRALAVVISILGYLLIVESLLRLTLGTQHFARFMAAMNWVGAVQVGIGVPLLLLTQLQMVPLQAAQLIGIVVSLWSLFFQGLAARRSLEVGRLAAAGLVVLDIFTSQFVDSLAEATLWPPAAG